MSHYNVNVLWDTSIGLVMIEMVHGSFESFTFKTMTFVEDDEETMIRRAQELIESVKIDNLRFTFMNPNTGMPVLLKKYEHGTDYICHLYYSKIFPIRG